MRPWGVFLILLLYTTCTSITAQIIHNESCGHDLLLDNLKKENPSHLEAYQQIYKAATTNIFSGYNKDLHEVYRIPIVVHIVWRNFEENIPRSRIEDQIAVLNEDFRRLNADAEDIRPEFNDAVGDAHIEFDLIDIIRVHTDTTFRLEFDWTNLNFKFPDHLKDDDTGGSSPWNVNSYLNIWVCPIVQDAIFGYAYPPSGLINWPENEEAPKAKYDGVVINYKAFGRELAPFINVQGDTVALRGRTLIHEVGHYLGLRHPWGDGDVTMEGCGFDDGLKDTPNTAGPNSFTCNADINSCQEGDEDRPDMIENFMDYSNEECKNSFTKNQIAVMRYVLENSRKELRIKEIPNPNNENIILYPNPARDNITAHVTSLNTNYKIETRSITGHVFSTPYVVNRFGSTVDYSIDLSRLPAGIYLISFTDINQTIFTKKVIISPH